MTLLFYFYMQESNLDLIMIELCAKCRLPYNRYDRRPELIDCETVICKSKFHNQCHDTEISKGEYARMKRGYHEKV